jgi:hypothetical protein
MVEKDAVSKDFRKQVLRLRTDNSGNRLSPSGSSLVAANLRLAGLRYVSEFPGAKGFPRVLGKITRRTPVRSYRCALETHQASRTTRRRRRVPVALTQLEQLRPNCGSEVKSVRRPDRRKLPNGFTVDVEVKSTQAEHLRDRNPITFDLRNLRLRICSVSRSRKDVGLFAVVCRGPHICRPS